MRSYERREFVAAVGSVVVAGMAGCIGSGEDSSNGATPAERDETIDNGDWIENSGTVNTPDGETETEARAEDAGGGDRVVQRIGVETPVRSGGISDGEGGTDPLYASGAFALRSASAVMYESGAIAVVGRLENTEQWAYDQARVHVQFHGQDGAVIDSSLAVLDNFGGYDVWEFEAPYPGADLERVDTAAITEIVAVG